MPSGEADLREEITAVRTAGAAHRRATMSTLGRMQAIMAAANSPSLVKPRAAKNTEVRSKNFFAPLYPGAQDEDGFQESWAALLSSDFVCAKATLGIGVAIVQAINETGRKPEPTNRLLVDAVIGAAIESGKGMPQRVRTPPHAQRALVTVPVVAQLPRGLRFLIRPATPSRSRRPSRSPTTRTRSCQPRSSARR